MILIFFISNAKIAGSVKQYHAHQHRNLEFAVPASVAQGEVHGGKAIPPDSVRGTETVLPEIPESAAIVIIQCIKLVALLKAVPLLTSHNRVTGLSELNTELHELIE